MYLREAVGGCGWLWGGREHYTYIMLAGVKLRATLPGKIKWQTHETSPQGETKRAAIQQGSRLVSDWCESWATIYHCNRVR